jgi:uncharacterized protein (TIGR03000 family)
VIYHGHAAVATTPTYAQAVPGVPANGALVQVELPADAKLTFDGVATKSSETVRNFATPVLQPGSEYSYTLTAEIVREGKTMTATRTITVKANEVTSVKLDANAFGVAVAAASK